MRNPSDLPVPWSVLFLALLAVSLAAASQAAPGDLDPTFGTNGTTVTDFQGFADTGYAVALQADRKILVAGSSLPSDDYFTGKDFAVARYNPDGTLDSGFGVDGKVLTDFGGRLDLAVAIAVQADGKIVVAGRSQDNADVQYALARYNADGSLDGTFGSGGMVMTVISGNNDLLKSMAIQADQKIVITGESYNPTDDFTVVRYKTDGSLDPTFGVGGIVTTDFLGSVDGARAIRIQPDQKILVAGFASDTSYFQFALARYNQDGSLDTTFGSDHSGKVVTDFFGTAAEIEEIALAPDGAMVAAGLTFNEMSLADAFALARYKSDGTVDNAFGANGAVRTNFGTVPAASLSVVAHPNGKIIASGYTQAASDDSDFALVGYNPDGSIDLGFGTDGIVLTDFSGQFDSISGSVLQPDGKLIAVGGGGDPNRDFALARYFTGLPPLNAQSLNISTRGNVGTGDKVLIGGFIVTGDTAKKVILRAIGPSLSLDSSAVLNDPNLDLHEPDGSVITNNNWRDTQEQEIIATGLVPPNALESAIVATLAPGAYTTIVSGRNSGSGIALVEAYDLDQTIDSQLTNISTRGSVAPGDDVMIGGFILGGAQPPSTVVVRGIGPSLGESGVANPLPDPMLDLYNGEGTLLASDDNWKDDQEAEIESAGFAPTQPEEAAIIMDLGPGSYTAILRGKDNSTGVGLIEAYNLL